MFPLVTHLYLNFTANRNTAHCISSSILFMIHITSTKYILFLCLCYTLLLSNTNFSLLTFTFSFVCISILHFNLSTRNSLYFLQFISSLLICSILLSFLPLYLFPPFRTLSTPNPHSFFLPLFLLFVVFSFSHQPVKEFCTYFFSTS
jgi:hypothetical protein